MASRVSSHRWLLREIRPAYVLLVLVAFVVAIFSYFIDWSSVRRESAARPNSGNAARPKGKNIEQHYTGSIIIPTGKGLCWTFILNNRTGNMLDGGYLKCDEAMRQFAGNNPHEGMDTLRLREVGKAFRHNSD
jgi:hypothetical protein